MRIKSDPYYLPFNPNIPKWSGVYKINGELILRFPAITPVGLQLSLRII